LFAARASVIPAAHVANDPFALQHILLIYKNYWQYDCMNVIERIANLADIDTRRAMGFPPRKLNKPHIPWSPWIELFFYSPGDKKLVYHEVGRYGYYYTEVITNIIPISRTQKRWKLLKNAKVRGIVYNDGLLKHYDVPLKNTFPYCTAGWPVFQTQSL
jgi:hypothetical protein